MQASIDYLRYLQDCIGDLKQATATNPKPRMMPEIHASPAFSPISSTAMSTPYLSPEMEPETSNSQMPTPRMMSSDEKAEKDQSPVWPSTHSSMTNSPEFQPHKSPMIPPTEGHNIDQDQNEATAALLMLNRDRRLNDPSHSGVDEKASATKQSGYTASRPRSSVTGMSVKELLS